VFCRCRNSWPNDCAGEEGEDQRADEVPAGAGARVQQGHRQGLHARRDHQLRPIPAETSRGSCPPAS
jgi:hypothetical protein